MQFKKHSWFGFLIGIIGAVFLFPDIEQIIFCIVFCLIASVAPDLDTRSKISSLFIGIVIFFVIISLIFPEYNLWIILVILILVLILRFLVKHRTMTHTIVFAIVFAGAVFFLTNSWIVSVCTLCAYLSHLFLDRI